MKQKKLKKIKEGNVSKNLHELFTDNEYPLSQKAIIEEREEGWIVKNQSPKKEYEIVKDQKDYKVYSRLKGAGDCRRMRKAGNIPAVIYGGKKEILEIALPEKEFKHFLQHPQKEVTLKLKNTEESVIIQDIQIDAITEQVLHVDFIRVTK